MYSCYDYSIEHIFHNFCGNILNILVLLGSPCQPWHLMSVNTCTSHGCYTLGDELTFPDHQHGIALSEPNSLSPSLVMEADPFSPKLFFMTFS